MADDSNSPEKPRVLIIDDEDGPRESMRMLLKPLYNVVCASSVDEGVDAVREHRPDVVVSDIRMPGTDGIEGLRRIRNVDATVSVIMLTGYGTLETARSAIQLGAADYVKKPFDTKEMLGVIEENVRRTGANRKREDSGRNLRNLNEVLMAELEQKRGLAKMGQASRELAHDLQNPLMIVVGSVELLSNELHKLEDSLYEAGDMEEGEQVQDYINVIEKSLHRCTELLGVWRNLGREHDVELQRVELQALLSDLVAEIQALTTGNRVAFVLEQEGIEGLWVMADPVQFPRTLMNLVSNAMDVLPEEGGELRLGVRREEGVVCISLSDNGSGIPDEILPRIFEPYFTTKQEGKGTGLGLYIARRILTRHHGTIEVESDSGAGTTFFMRIPFETRQ